MLDDGEKAQCMEIAREIVEHTLTGHIDSCPHGKTIMASKMLLVGMCLGSGAASGGLVFGLIKMLAG